MMRQSKSSFSEEFKKEAVLLVTEGDYSMEEAGKNLGVSPKNISRWKKEYREGRFEQIGSSSSSQKEELEALRKENRRLKIEREILKKAAVFFAKEGM